MTAPWWGKEASPGAMKGLGLRAGIPSPESMLVLATRNAVLQEVSARIDSYVPEWSNRRPGEAGDALVHLFSEEMEPVLQRLNQLPDKSYVEFLRAAGVQPLPPIPAEAVLQFTVADSAPQSVYVPQGFQVGAPPASGGGDMVIFETDADLYALPGNIQELYALEKGFYRSIDATKDGVPFQPFGANPRPGSAFFIGIAANPGVIPGPQLSLGIQVQGAAGQPPPAASGGVVPLPAPLAPLLQWDALDGVNYQQLEVITDQTAGLLHSGVVTLSLPEQWRPGIPQGSPSTTPMLWLRLQITYGAYAQSPVLLAVKLNMVPASAAQTFRDEVLTPVPDAVGSVWLLSHTPVLPGTLYLVVDDTADLSFTPGQSAAAATLRRWREVDELSQFGPEDEVYVLDPGSGQVTFGDGDHGKARPPGFRNVIAQSYQVGGGAAGAVAANKISTLVTSVPFISAVTNPWPASGGSDAETQEEAKRHGPREIRARGRAVALADYEILALRAQGARIKRAHAVSGFHPSFPGTPIPGVVGVFVIPDKRGAGPPIADEQMLRALSVYLTGEAAQTGLAPAGVEVVAAAPVFHRVRVETTVVIDPAVSRGDAVRDVLNTLDSYFDPVTGGDDGQGWPFGGTLSNAAVVRQLLTSVKAITAVSRLAFVVDGVRRASCADFPIAANSLLWPAGHQVLALGPGEQP